ncbi:MAG: hypothetical protein ACXWK1_01215 [Caulobacteraceae bacterium]
MSLQSQIDVSHACWQDPSGVIVPGDLVCTGANVNANHEVIAVYGDKAWIRDLRSGCDGITNLSRCHKA